MREMRSRGETFKAIGEAFGLTGERVRMILREEADALFLIAQRDTIRVNALAEKFGYPERFSKEAHPAYREAKTLLVTCYSNQR